MLAAALFAAAAASAAAQMPRDSAHIPAVTRRARSLLEIVWEELPFPTGDAKHLAQTSDSAVVDGVQYDTKCARHTPCCTMRAVPARLQHCAVNRQICYPDWLMLTHTEIPSGENASVLQPRYGIMGPASCCGQRLAASVRVALLAPTPGSDPFAAA